MLPDVARRRECGAIPADGSRQFDDFLLVVEEKRALVGRDRERAIDRFEEPQVLLPVSDCRAVEDTVEMPGESQLVPEIACAMVLMPGRHVHAGTATFPYSADEP